ncbi:MAG: recombination-associated protein RdgC, partial [Pseudomonadales bacterium]
SFPVALPDSKSAPGAVMTRLLKVGKASDGFEINDDCELFNPTDGSNVVRCKGQDLMGDEIQSHLDAGKQARHLGVVWKSENRLGISLLILFTKNYLPVASHN